MNGKGAKHQQGDLGGDERHDVVELGHDDHRDASSAGLWQNTPKFSEKMRLIAIAGFGLAALGLFTIFNSTSAPISFAACTMYIVGSVLGVLLLQIEIVSRGQGHSENSPEQHNALKGLLSFERS